MKQKKYYLLYEETDSLLTKEEKDLYNRRKLTIKEIEQIKLSRIETSYTEEEQKLITLYYLLTDGYSYDSNSLSYIYPLSSDKWILMLASSVSELNYEFDTNFVGGEISKETLNWMEDNLKYAKENNIEVISAMHHNLLFHNELFKNSYTLFFMISPSISTSSIIFCENATLSSRLRIKRFYILKVPYENRTLFCYQSVV